VSDVTITFERVLKAARQHWPKACRIAIESPSIEWSDKNGTTHGNYKFTRWHRDCDGDELASWEHYDSLEEIMEFINARASS
jgi:hypothetical protein